MAHSRLRSHHVLAYWLKEAGSCATSTVRCRVETVREIQSGHGVGRKASGPECSGVTCDVGGVLYMKSILWRPLGLKGALKVSSIVSI